MADAKLLNTILEKIKENGKLFENASGKSKNSQLNSYYQYFSRFHKEKLFELLLLDPLIAGDIEEAQKIVWHLEGEAYRALIDELSQTQLVGKIKYVNERLRDFQIAPEDLLGYPEPLKMLEDIYDITLNLCYEKLNPIRLFESFIAENSIRFLPGKEKGRFKFMFPAEVVLAKRKRYYYCNNLAEFFQICSSYMLDQTVKEIVEIIFGRSQFPLRQDPSKHIDIKIVNSFGTDYQRLYMYLTNIDYVKANVMFQRLYLLLYYDKIDIFKDDTTMDKVLKRIRLNLYKAKDTVEKYGYFPYPLCDTLCNNTKSDD